LTWRDEDKNEMWMDNIEELKKLRAEIKELKSKVENNDSQPYTRNMLLALQAATVTPPTSLIPEITDQVTIIVV